MLLFLAQMLEDIRDIHGPALIPQPWWVNFLWAVSIAAALALIIFLARWIFKTKKTPQPGADEIALEKLEQASRQMNAGLTREFSFLVTEAVREYIEARFRVDAANRTTEEFISDLLSQPDSPLTAYRETLKDFLQHCDFVKFARGSLNHSEMQKILESARAIVNETRPKPEADVKK